MEHIMDEEDVEGFYKAKIQILEHNLQRAARDRDEYKMQLDAANKEIQHLKQNINDSISHIR